MVSAQGEQFCAVLAGFVRIGFNGGDGLFDVEGVHTQVAAVGNLLPGERVNVGGLVVGAQQFGGLADVGGTEPGAAAVADTGVKGDADDLDVDRLAGALCFDFVDARQQAEGRRACKARGQAVVGGAQGLVVAHVFLLVAGDVS